MNRRWLRDLLLTALLWAAVWDGLALLAGLFSEALPGLSLEKQLDPLAAPALPGFGFGLLFGLWNPRHRALALRDGALLRRYLLRGVLLGLLPPLLARVLGSPRPPVGGTPFDLAWISIALCALAAAATALLHRLFPFEPTSPE